MESYFKTSKSLIHSLWPLSSFITLLQLLQTILFQQTQHQLSYIRSTDTALLSWVQCRASNITN